MAIDVGKYYRVFTAFCFHLLQKTKSRKTQQSTTKNAPYYYEASDSKECISKDKCLLVHRRLHCSR
jgi:hypothetical protein